MKISVCIAAYNGELYIKRQLMSILCQLGNHDEIILVDDFSADNTVKIVESLRDVRIKIYKNPYNLGFLKTFEKSIELSSGDIIILCDQDDLWQTFKIKVLMSHFDDPFVDVILHDAIVVDEKFRVIYDSFNTIKKPDIHPFKNFVSNTFTGCCMAFRQEVRKSILPIPQMVKYHDRWIAIMTGILGKKLKIIPDKLIFYVRHGKNASPMQRRKIFLILYDRIILLICICRHLIEKLYRLKF